MYTFLIIDFDGTYNMEPDDSYEVEPLVYLIKEKDQLRAEQLARKAGGAFNDTEGDDCGTPIADLFEKYMKTENNNIIFTILNKKLIFSLGIIVFLSLIAVILFFTVIRAEYIVLGLPFVFFLFVLPIFMIGMRNKIIYRFTINELQYRGENPYRIQWKDITSFNIDSQYITLNLKDNTSKTLPVLNFNTNELHQALSIYIK